MDIVTMGEMLIDFVPLEKGLSLKDNQGFLRMPGGAPANVAVGVAKLGLKTAFLGKVGQDPFGRLLIDTLADNGVEVRGIIQTNKAKTTLAFVTLDEAGDRDFTFYRDPGADMLFKWGEVDQDFLTKTKIFHHGSISLINEPVRSTTIEMAKKVREMGNLVSYDPNLRMPLWPNKNEARKWIVGGLKTANIVKMSEEELEFITGEDDIDSTVPKIMDYGIELLFITLGSKGSYYYNDMVSGIVPGFKVDVQDTTGAGDAFVAGALSELIKNNLCEDLKNIDKVSLENVVRYANAVGALTTMGKGAISSLPGKTAVQELLLE